MNIKAQRLGLGGSTFSVSPFVGVTGPKKDLGQNDQSWYARARTAVAEYDNLWQRVQNLAPQQVRNDLAVKYHADPNDSEGALYRRNSVAYALSQADASVPINYLVFNTSQQQNRVKKLEAWNSDFKEDLEYNEKTYGTLSPVQYVEKLVNVNASSIPSWVIPAAVMGGVAVIGIILWKSRK